MPMRLTSPTLLSRVIEGKQSLSSIETLASISNSICCCLIPTLQTRVGRFNVLLCEDIRLGLPGFRR